METRFRQGRVAAGILEGEAERSSLRDLFARVAAEHDWRPGGDLDSHSLGSAYVGAWVEGRLAGGILLRAPDESDRLPIHAAWPELLECDPPRPAELVLLALAPESRGTPGLLWSLCAEMWRHCDKAGVTDLLAAATPRNLRVYSRLGWCPEAVGPLKDHWGDPCLPCRIGIAAVAETVAARVASDPSLAGVLERAYRP